MQLNNYAHYWCTVVVERLIEVGVDHFFIGPGSRSTPLVSAVVRQKRAQIISCIDERSLGYSALGYAKRAASPAAIIVTSGTAVANLYPAIAESYLSSVPLLVITADRPFELRDCGANQTMFQPLMFAQHVVKSFDVAPPNPVVPLSLSVAIFDQAYRVSRGPRSGPVHINVQLREPLSNIVHDNEPSWSPEEHIDRSAPEICLSTSTDLSNLKDFFMTGRGLIAVGELLPSGLQEMIVDLASRLTWPIFADVTSNLRLRRHPQIVTHFDLALLSPAFLSTINFDRVVKFGGRIVSKRFWSLIERMNRSFLVSLSESPERIDHTGMFSHHAVSNLTSGLSSLLSFLPQSQTRGDFTASTHYQAVVSRVNGFLENKTDNEAYCAARLVAQISEPTTLFVSSSMPIRDLDQFATPTDNNVEIYASRGVSGIDGIISTAMGMALVGDKPVITLIGDVAFLHDTNGLMLAKATRAPILIVVINNNGGGIFHFLPIANELDVVTPFLDTPHQISIEGLTRAHGLAYEFIDNAKAFDDAIATFFRDRQSMIVEVKINRETNVALHKNFYKHLASL